MHLEFYFILIICTKFCTSTSQFYRSHKYHMTSRLDDDSYEIKSSTQSTPFAMTTMNILKNHHKFRHHSNRYSKFDNLINRMKNYDLTRTTTTTTTTPTPVITTERSRNLFSSYHHNWGNKYATVNKNNGGKKSFDSYYDGKKVNNNKKHKYLSSKSSLTALGGASFDEYDDNIDDDSEMESEPNEYDIMDTYDDDYDEDDEDSDNDDKDTPEFNWQAEDSNRDNANNFHSSFTLEKWDRYGTAQKVAQTRDNHFKKGGSYLQLRNEADMHLLRMNNEGACKIPRPRVISVQTIHPDSSRTYLPSCTILHRCADDTGCCGGHGTCTAKKEEIVKLYFHIIDFTGNKTIELLKFDNHTECECKSPKYDSMEASDAEGITRRDIPEDYEDDIDPLQLLQKCKCPSDYTAEINNNVNCQCVCKSDKCNQRNVGKEHFSYKDRTCIQFEECERPSCLHGTYKSAFGLCPKKEDKIRLYSDINNRTIHSHRKRNKY